MSRSTKAVLLWIIASATIYLGFAFVIWDFGWGLKINEWSPMSRLSLILLIVFSVFCVCVTMLIGEDGA